MATIGTAFNIATGALDADQAALDIVANNTANVNTPGYTLETPLWQQLDSASLSGANYGMGVAMTGPQSQRDRVLQQAVQQQTQTEGASAARLDALNQMQALFSGATSAGTSSSAASGIGSDLSGFFDTLSSLEANPSDVASRQNVLSAATTLAQDFNAAATQLESQRQGLDEQSTSVVSQANTLLQNVAQLNLQIESLSPSGDAGTLEDQRQQDLTSLSQLIGIRTVTTENNGLTVTTMGGALLVSEGQSFSITTGESNGVTHYYDSVGSDITGDLTAAGGQLGGILTSRDQDIPQVENALDTLAYAVATQMNTMNEQGSDLNGNAGAAIFGLPASATAANPAGSAAQITVTMTNPTQIAAAAAGGGSSDNSNALTMANQQNAGFVNGMSPTSWFSDMVTSLGSLTAEVSSENTAQQAGLTQLQNQMESISGVNLNDEAAALETLEQSYQAASKLFTTLDQVMVSALNLGVETTYT
ncbi:MAG TPA: flagellar hook-associated protein FlgK [Acidobacteriaceae bacterium]|nr:flagellar hook-associated protein FlgK [Acidobacteriaceae bacterium]